MKSVSASSPSGEENRVRSTLVSPTYSRSTRNVPRGAIAKRPPRSSSRMAAKREGLSNCGQQSQSTDPAREISAADLPSPTIA